MQVLDQAKLIEKVQGQARRLYWLPSRNVGFDVE
jgi:hypothetical protein